MTTKMPRSVSISFNELFDACEFVSFSNDYDHQAYICANTGKIYFASTMADVEEDVPDDLQTSDQYISVPHKHDLNIGRNLVFDFVDRELPDAEHRVGDMFRRRGAWRRFKDFLRDRDLLDKWHAFEAKSMAAALRAWCEENDIPLRDT
jgi:hypothetical protein